MGLKGFFRVAVLATGLSAVVPCFSTDVSPQEWAKTLIRQELKALESGFQDLHAMGRLPKERFQQTLALARGMREELKNADEQTLQIQSAKYIALTDYLAVAQLGALVELDEKPPETLTQAAKESEQILETLSSPGSVEVDRLVEDLRRLEKSTLVARDGLLSAKRQAALRGAILQLQALAEAEPALADRHREGARLLKLALDHHQQGKAQEAETLVASAVNHSFGAQSKTWDGRYLWHHLQLRLLVAAVESKTGVPAADKQGLRRELESLSSLTDSEAYARASEDLVRRCVKYVPAKDNDGLWGLTLQPERAQAVLSKKLLAMRGWLPEVRDALQKNETFLQSFQSSYKKSIDDRLRRMDSQFEIAARQVRTSADWKVVSRFYRSVPMLQTLTLYTVEAILDRSSAVADYHAVWTRGLKRMRDGLPILDDDDRALLQKGLQTERREGVRRAWLNRHNANVAALSVLLAAEAISVPFTGGGSAAAMPATLSLMTTVGTTGAKVVLISNSALNIADRAHAKGLRGLANMDTAFDALMILTLAPRPMLGAAPATTMLGRFNQAVLKSIAESQYTAAALLSVATPAYGGYLIAYADSISDDMKREGIVVTPAEIRRKGLVNIAVGILAMRENARYYREGVAKNGEAFIKETGDVTWSGSVKQFVNQFRQIHNVKQFYTKNPGVWGKLGAAGLGLSYAAYDTIFVTEGLLLSYATLDSSFTAHADKVHPLPDLQGDETAVLVTGFEPADYLLYAGAQARYSNRAEIRKYGDKFFSYTYDSPENLMDVLERHAAEHGPVRYLKVFTHGRPGRLFTPAVHSAPEASLSGGWIDSAWLVSNRTALKKRSKKIFAPDTRVRLYSCLVGANLDEDRGEGKDVGERFMERLGNTLLVNGGSIDASNRIIMGLDAAMGTGVDFALKDPMRPAAPRPQFVLPVTKLVGDEDLEDLGAGSDSQDEVVADGWKAKLANTLEVGKALASRMVGILTFWPPVWWEFGVNLEGPFWADRYRSLDFPAQP